MRLILLLLPVIAFGQVIPPQRVLVTSEHFVWHPTGAGGSNGDTPIFSSWSAAGTGGIFNGGRVFGTVNDGQIVGSASGNMLILELTAFNQNSIAASALTLVNNMADYGTAGVTNSTCTAAASSSTKSDAVWFDGGVMYINMFCQNGSPTWATYKSWINCSNDFGATWENYAHVVAHGGVCNSTVWGSATGDIPGTASTDVQWWPASGANDHTGKMGKLALVQLAQDGATTPALPGGLSNTCHYFISNTEYASNVNHELYLHKYCSPDNPMLPASWVHYAAGSWVTNPDISTTITPTGWNTQTAFSQTAMYDPKSKLFYLEADGAFAHNYTMAYSTDLAHWTELDPIVAGTVEQGTQFGTFMLPTYAAVPGTHFFTISVAQNNNDGPPPSTCQPTSTSWCYVPGFAQVAFNPPNVSSGARVGQ
jgi:hypothetical protein